MPLLPALAIYRELDTVGDGTGTKNAIGDYSGAGAGATEFLFQPDAPCWLSRVIIAIEDTAGMSASDYGNITSGLTNGWALKVFREGVEVLDFSDGETIKTNAGIGRMCYDVDLKTWSTGNEYLLARFTFSRAGQELYLPENHKLSLTFSDDLTGLVQHRFKVQGYYARD